MDVAHLTVRANGFYFLFNNYGKEYFWITVDLKTLLKWQYLKLCCPPFLYCGSSNYSLSGPVVISTTAGKWECSNNSVFIPIYHKCLEKPVTPMHYLLYKGKKGTGFSLKNESPWESDFVVSPNPITGKCEYSTIFASVLYLGQTTPNLIIFNFKTYTGMEVCDFFLDLMKITSFFTIFFLPTIVGSLNFNYMKWRDNFKDLWTIIRKSFKGFNHES